MRDWPTPEEPTILQLRQLAAAFDTAGDPKQAGYLRLCATLVVERAMPLEQARRHLERYREILRTRHPEITTASIPTTRNN